MATKKKIASIIDFFKKDIDFKSDIERFRTQSLIRFILIGILLLSLFMIKTIIVGTYSSLYVQSVILLILFLSLFLFRLGKHKFVGNFLSLFLILFESSSVFFNYSGDIPMNFMVDEFYLFIAFLVFTPMFASKWLVLVNTLIVIISSIIAFYFKKNAFPPEIVHTAAIGIGVYILSVIIVFIFSYLYTDILYKAISELHKKFKSEEEKNKELLQNAQMIRFQNEEIQIAKEKAEESNRLKSSFLSNMSHEIRTPMNAVLGFTEILKTTELNDKQEGYIKIIETSGKHLLNLINDIIDISKLESNQIKIEESQCHLNFLLNELKDFFIRFLIKVGEVESSEKEEDAPYYDYKTYRKTTADSRGSIEKRFNISLSKFLEFFPDIKPKDPTRGFNYWEKLAVYWRDRGICQMCGKKIPFEQGSVDHKIPHSKGGLTTIANSQWLCRKCNLKKLDKTM